MILSADELEILDYLKSWKGNYVSMVEICRCAGGRRKYREAPNWAKQYISRLVDAKLVVVNERGHFCCPLDEHQPPVARKKSEPVAEDAALVTSQTAVIVGDDYFPSDSSEADLPLSTVPETWISPQIAAILKKSGKKTGGVKND